MFICLLFSIQLVETHQDRSDHQPCAFIPEVTNRTHMEEFQVNILNLNSNTGSVIISIHNTLLSLETKIMIHHTHIHNTVTLLQNGIH